MPTIGAFAAVFDDRRRMLLVRRAYGPSRVHGIECVAVPQACVERCGRFWALSRGAEGCTRFHELMQRPVPSRCVRPRTPIARPDASTARTPFLAFPLVMGKGLFAKSKGVAATAGVTRESLPLAGEG